MWILSILFAPFLIYGLWTGRMPVGGRGGWRVYSRETEPRWYWTAGAVHFLLITLPIVGTFYPRFIEVFFDIVPYFLLAATLAILAVVVYSTSFKRDRD